MTLYTLKSINPTTNTSEFFLPHFNDLSISYAFSDVGSISLKYDALGLNAAIFDSEQEVAVYREGIEIDNSRFIVQSRSSDTADEIQGSYSLAGRSILGILAQAIVYGESATSAVHANFTDATPGKILDVIFQQNKDRGGVLKKFTWNFNAVSDSAGNAWAKKYNDITFNVGVNYLKIVQSMVANGMIEVSVKGRELYIVSIDDLGVDRTTGANPVTLLLGRDILEAPTRETTEGVASSAIIQGDDGVLVSRHDPQVESLFGRREMYMSQGGIKDEGTLGAILEQQLLISSRKRVEFTHKIDISSAQFLPHKDYTTGDWVFTKTRGISAERVRVRQIVVSIEPDGVTTCSLVLNDKFLESEIVTSRRIEGITGGSSYSGGTSLPTDNRDNQVDKRVPAQVQGVQGTSLTYFDSVMQVYMSTINLTWQPVTRATDGTEIDIEVYEVWRNWGANGPTMNGAWKQTEVDGNQTSLDLSSIDMDSTWYFMVIARTKNGYRSQPSNPYEITTASDVVPPAQPSAPIVETTNLNTVTIRWDGLSYTGAVMAPDTRNVILYRRRSGTADAWEEQGELVSKSDVIVLVDSVPGQAYDYRFIAYDYSPNRNASTPSSVTTGTTTLLVDVDSLTGVFPKEKIDPTWRASLDTSIGNAQTAATNAKSTADAAAVTANEVKATTSQISTDLDAVEAALPGKADKSYADSIQQLANTAKTTADTAVSNAATAKTAADNAASTASAANTKALEAAGIANAKGKVYYQTSAPTGDANSLWIDTTSNANTPKRWNGNAWVAVTDKVAIDAAAAAAAANTAAGTAQTKANQAQTDATKALADAATAASAAATADGKAVSAQNAANLAKQTADAANTIANTAKTVGEQAKAVGDDALAKVNTATTNINTINSILPSKADTSYVQSRGTDLVANGTGFLGSNFNFSQTQYVGNDAPAGANGSFLTSASSATITTDEYIPIDPSKNYVLAFNARQTGDPSTANATLLGGYVPYDQFNNPIVPFNFSYFAGTTVALTAPLNVGDTTVKVTSTAGWNTSATTSLKYVIAWSYIDAGGRVWPEHTYSRDSFAYTEIIDSTTIRLAAPWAGRARGIGATVSNGRSGSYYVYLGSVNQAIPTTWTRYVGTIRGVFDGSTAGGSTGPFPQGTAKIRMVWLPNRNTSGTYLSGSRHAIGGVSLSDAAAAQQDASAALAAAVTAQTTANTAATSAAGKTKVIYSSITPTGSGTAVGDTWFQRGADGIVVGVWEWSGAAWAPRTLNHQTISSIDAGKISVGTLDVANRISAQSMTVDKLLIGSSENLIPNGGGEYNGGGGIWNSAQTQWVVDAASPSGAGYFRCPAGTRTIYGAGVKTADASMLPSTPQWQVEPGAEYYYELWIRADKPNSRLYIEVRNQAFNQAGFCYAIPGEESGSEVGTANPGSYWLANKIVPTTWMKVSGVFRANADTTSAYVRAIMYNHANGTELNAQVDIAGFRLQKRATGRLIVDGSITAKQIKAESLTVDLMAANSIGATQIIGQAVVAGKLGANAVIAGNIASDVVTAKEIMGESITTAELATNAVTTRVLNSEAVTSDKIMAFAVVAGKIAVNAVVAGNIAASAVTTDTIAALAITTEKIAANAIVASKILAGEIRTAHIAALNVTAAKLASDSVIAGKIAANAVVAGNVAADAIQAGNIAADAVTSREIDALAIKAEHIAVGAVDASKLDNTWKANLDATILDAKMTLGPSATPAGSLPRQYNHLYKYSAASIANGTWQFLETPLPMNVNGDYNIHMSGKTQWGNVDVTFMVKVRPADPTYKATVEIDSQGIQRLYTTSGVVLGGANVKLWFRFNVALTEPWAIYIDKLEVVQGPAPDSYMTATWTYSSSTTLPASTYNASVRDLQVVNQWRTPNTDNINGGMLTARTIVSEKIATDAIVADLIATNAITSTKIQAGAITAGKIAATAFEGQSFTGGTFTGGTFRTSASGQRVIVNGTDNRIEVWDANNVNVVNMGKLTSGAGTGLEVRLGNQKLVPLDLIAFGGNMNTAGSPNDLHYELWTSTNGWSEWLQPNQGTDNLLTWVEHTGTRLAISWSCDALSSRASSPDDGGALMADVDMAIWVWGPYVNGVNKTSGDGRVYNSYGSTKAVSGVRSYVSTWQGMQLKQLEMHVEAWTAFVLPPGRYCIQPVYRVCAMPRAIADRDLNYTEEYSSARLAKIDIGQRSIQVVQG